MNLQQKVVVVVMDFLLIAELAISIYFANHDPEFFTPIFMKYFLTMAIPTLVLARVFVKRLRPKESVIQS